ncbi:lipopolysaccharide-induced tumor necrosis factor-alpha factor homolog [Brienomyrus brachyistius]|uniref:lipopolysaccharide-induced tumor necrosis factor-alpha factor homolog n=1 Tax=Brienomyrus brachyistius TaxID=42636 RepID=UPI0020B4406E|nr:lipopolysaccharide-induced tumor necrosis factor-alpha factor homolog [Brienomyrus brachyistius]
MASAPPLETVGLAFSPQPPSYEEAMSSPYPPGFVQPPPAFSKPEQGPYPVQPYGPPTTSQVVSVQTVYVQPRVVFGSQPVQTHCPMCMQMVLTRLEHNAGTMTWLTCAGLFIFGCFYGCCLIPFCVDDLKDVNHRCPNCSTVLGTYKRL